MILPPSHLFDHLEERLSCKEVQFKMFGSPLKTSCTPTENFNETPVLVSKSARKFLLSNYAITFHTQYMQASKHQSYDRMFWGFSNLTNEHTESICGKLFNIQFSFNYVNQQVLTLLNLLYLFIPW